MLSEILLVIVTCWMALLASVYLATRLIDPWPRDLMRQLISSQFSRERSIWHQLLLFELVCMLILAILELNVALSTALTLRSISLACAFWRLIPHLTDIRKSLNAADSDSDPMFLLYRKTWLGAFGKPNDMRNERQ